jgi:hypothetical protein
MLDIPLSGSLLRVVVSAYFSIHRSGGNVATNLMMPSNANTCESISSRFLYRLAICLLLTLLQHPPKMRPTMLTGRTIAAIARGKIFVLATRLVCLMGGPNDKPPGIEGTMMFLVSGGRFLSMCQQIPHLMLRRVRVGVIYHTFFLCIMMMFVQSHNYSVRSVYQYL